MFWPSVDPEKASGVFSLLMFRPSTLKTKRLKGEEMRLSIQVSCSESLCIVAGDPERQTHIPPVHRPGCEVGEIVPRNTVEMYRKENTPRTSITKVLPYFFGHQFSSRKEGCRDLIQLREWLFAV